MKVSVSTVFFNVLMAFTVSAGSAWADDDSAYDQAASTAQSGEEAVGYANSGDDEDARATAGAGFDTAGSEATPPVYLNCDPCVVDPGDLKQYDPPEPSLQPSYVPPLPDSN